MTTLTTAARAKPTRMKRKCETCGERFRPTRFDQRRCSTACRDLGRAKAINSDRRVGRRIRRAQPTEFIAVDGEGMTVGCRREGCSCGRFQGDQRCKACHHDRDDHEHLYVLLGCGDQQLEGVTAEGKPRQLLWHEVFTFLWHCHKARPYAAMVGFFLGYDFTQWLRTLPEQKAWALLTEKGRQHRTVKPRVGTKGMPARPVTRSVAVVAPDGIVWELEVTGAHRLSIRPRLCDCRFRRGVPCRHRQHPYLHICDAGPFFQKSFLSVIDPKDWLEGQAPCTPEEYALVERGKVARADAGLDDDMRRYNRLENLLLSRVMCTLDKGFRSLGIKLKPSEWYGPGAASGHWLSATGAPRATFDPPPAEVLAKRSFLGGWFEVCFHGLVPGTVSEYDLVSAYPAQIALLPCLQHGKWSEITTRKELALIDLETVGLCLVEAQVTGNNPYLGAMMHRDPDLHISRPQNTGGAYWAHELVAANRAGLVSSVTLTRALVFEPGCDCPPPLRAMTEMYRQRLAVGKKTSMGKASKLTMNSGYGKLAQAVGGAPFQNYLWASLITAGCRCRILEAIATHPLGAAAVVMVATVGGATNLAFHDQRKSRPVVPWCSS